MRYSQTTFLTGKEKKVLIKEIHLFEISIFNSTIYKIYCSDQTFVLTLPYQTDLYSLRPLGDWAPFLRHLYLTPPPFSLV
jgi:hypothetical protein